MDDETSWQSEQDHRALDALSDSENTVLALRPNLTIAYTNRGWDHFALESATNPEQLDVLDRPILSLLAPAVRPFYRRLFRKVLETHEPACHEYDCPTPTLTRRFKLRVTPHGRGLLLIHHPVAEGPCALPACEPLMERYVNSDGMIVQCCHCRMTRRGDDKQTWDWVPQFVAHQPDNLSHGLCPTCFRHYYPVLAQRWAEQQAAAH